MTQYVDKSALLAEIEKRKIIAREKAEIASGNNNVPVAALWSGKENICNELLSFLDTLEVKEVDLEKELSYEDYKSFFEKYPDLSDDWGFDETWSCAKYFFELGLKAQKGE